ncbi:MAG: hypothetical protein AAF985_25655, partial [Bacteroidota bacterium]
MLFFATVAKLLFEKYFVQVKSQQTNELQALAINGTELSISNGNMINLAGIDTNTQLSEQQVDSLVSNNGFLTTELDGSTTNEIQDLSSVLNEGSDAGDKALVNVNKMAIGTATSTPGVALEIDAASGAVLLPRMTDTQRNAITPILGMMIYNQARNKLQAYTMGPVEAIDQSVGGYNGPINDVTVYD